MADAAASFRSGVVMERQAVEFAEALVAEVKPNSQASQLVLQVGPVLVEGIERLLGELDKTYRDNETPLDPLLFLGSYLMRHNPKYSRVQPANDVRRSLIGVYTSTIKSSFTPPASIMHE